MKFSYTQWPLFSTKAPFALVLLPLLFTLLPATPASAWGPVGHETVAYIAMDNLSPAAKQNLNKLMNEQIHGASLTWHPQTLAQLSNWADEIRPTRPNTAPWHYIDLPIRVTITEKDEQTYCPDNNCVVNQLQIFEGVLGDESKSVDDRIEALKFIVHFMGDLQQPLHCADDSDRGGNEKLVRFKAPGHRGHGAKIKLHALWDHLIESKTGEDPRELATTLEKGITPGEKAAWAKGSEKNWAFESYMIAKTKIYPGMGPGSQDYTDNPLPGTYFDKMRPIVDQQLEKAGIRLAFVLNEIFK